MKYRIKFFFVLNVSKIKLSTLQHVLNFDLEASQNLLHLLPLRYLGMT